MILSIDIETFSDVDIKKAGVFKYVESPMFEILLISYKYDNGPVQTIDLVSGLDGDDLDSFLCDLQNPTILKTAYNAQFEITCLSKHFKLNLDPSQWRCTMARAAMIGLPFGLDFVANVLMLPVQKYVRGGHIKYFCCPCKPTKANGMRERNFPHHDPEKWKEFIAYNRQDVIVEREVDKKIDFFQLSEFEKPMWAIDQAVNNAGVMIDRQLVENAIEMNRVYTDKLIKEAIQITGLQNPKSVQQLKAWVEEETEEEISDLQKATVLEIIDNSDSEKVKKVLQIRQRISKSSIKKYQAMLNCVCADGRVRGLFQYYGANRTGRWAGRLVQVQNLVKNNMEDLDLARELVKEGDLDTLELMFGNVSRVLSQLCRTAFIPAPGKKFIVSDFSAIEARVIAWLAGEQWRLDVFNTHGKIYEASGAAMFGLRIEDIKKGSVERDASKIAELALGYQGAVGAMSSMIESERFKAIERGKVWTYNPTEAEMKNVVNKWRAANKKIVQLWYNMSDAALNCVAKREKTTCGKVMFHINKGVLFCTLPSGRALAYMRPKIVEGLYGPQVEYEGMNQTTKKWEKIRAYGGLWVENVTQAIARDLLAEKMKYLQGSVADLELVMHIHDELVFEADQRWDHKVIDKAMGEPVYWAPGLPLKGDGFETYYYKKDD